MTDKRKPTARAVARRARKILRRQVRRVQRQVDTALQNRRSAAVVATSELVGVVEEFAANELSGWVSVPDGAAKVRITLHLADVGVAGTWATDAGDARVGSNVKGFRLVLKDLWQFAGPDDRLTVRANGTPLPITGHGMHLVPTAAGGKDLAALVKRLDSGYVFSRVGALQLSKQLDTAWQKRMLDAYAGMRTTVREATGYDLFAMYGSLLGAVREQGFIGHDDDFDVAALVDASTAPQACAQLKRIAFALIDAGYDVVPRMSAVHVHHPKEHVRIDIFHLYFGDDGVLKFPFGAAGVTDFRRTAWQGLAEVPFGVGQVLVPNNAEALVETIYGANWRVPTPGFDWDRDRRVRAVEALMPLEDREEIYWANFYARTEYTNGSTFFEFVNARPDAPDHVIDIGCGDGRDSYAFGVAGRIVTGLDRSHIGVRHATQKAADMGLTNVGFTACDVGQCDELRAVLGKATAAAGDSAALFYARFFLHSIPEQTQETLMDAVRDTTRPGDLFAAEFRTTADSSLRKVHDKHYRRFQDGPAFGVALKERYGFELLFEVESTGLSVYKGEDPVLYRVVAVKR